MSTSTPHSSRIDGYWGCSARICALLRAQLVLGQSAGDAQRLAVVGNGHVRVAALGRGGDHVGDGAGAICQARVQVEVALNVAQLDQPRQLPVACQLDFARAFTQLRRNPG
jgi:hypothetical protein